MVGLGFRFPVLWVSRAPLLAGVTGSAARPRTAGPDFVRRPGVTSGRVPDGALSSHARWAGPPNLDWIYASPAPLIEPGGTDRRIPDRGDELLTDADGGNRITTPDYAAGIVDQLENPTAQRKQITFAD